MENFFPPGGRFRPYEGLKRFSSKNNNHGKDETNDPSHKKFCYSSTKTESVEDINEGENYVKSSDEEFQSNSGTDTELDDSQFDKNDKSQIGNTKIAESKEDWTERVNFGTIKSQSNLEEPVEVIPCLEELTELNSTRRSLSCDSEISATSSSVKSTISSENGHSVRSASQCSSIPNTSALKFPENTHEDSSSPLLRRKKKKPDIFKDTDSEEELKFEGCTYQYKHQTYVSDGEEEDGGLLLDSSSIKHSSLSDFELMMQQKQAERHKRYKRGTDFITPNDELIAQLIDRMEDAAYEDRQLNKCGLPATKKISMLKYVVSQLRKKDLQSIFLEHNILSTLTEWLSPLPSKCLPCLQIRESILRLLADFPRIDLRLLKHSGIGKALMFLRKHPDETKENQERCNSLIAKWARPLHDLSCDYSAMTKRERQLRDYALAVRYNKQKSKAIPTVKKIKNDILDITQSNGNSMEASRPGDPGWVPRARVPQPSVRDYIKRPESKLQCEISTKIKPSRFEILSKKYQKAQREKTIKYRGAKLSIVGDKM